MSGRQLTTWFLIAFVTAGVAWDLYVYTRYGVDATISRVVRDWARVDPVVPFALGLLMGHFFWWQR